MAVFGKTSIDLVKDVRGMEPDTITPFQDETLRNALDEVEEHHAALMELISAVSESGVEWGSTNYNDASSILVHHDSLLRNKRNLLAYLYARLNRIKQLRWQYGRALPADLEERLGPTEKQFFREYDRLIMDYMDPRKGVGLDLTLDMAPPKDHKIEVRVLKDYGELFSRDGPLILTRNSVHFLWREDAQPLYAEGVVETCQ
mmetsp:Transcript_7786/g.15926  ORF Transcript_7786/g.15926 Transcript_7786/m.15926 type:complete len:202 (-) Transcript_7786:417-1022(-)|eukprot:CAMPEP_0118948702 /NCGR_PEP_ID=MMETSP1169-20130426/48283_1 /TAXON_ID=36882 /ORGANISM="Pyramimonas obovata, Strain CCMP722" /LENGTH=201 /DNA_ID=CAMNT_0006895195 /DNA_START=185 /DNA_END=790 /DNA_ORIENTATION=-